MIDKISIEELGAARAPAPGPVPRPQAAPEPPPGARNVLGRTRPAPPLPPVQSGHAPPTASPRAGGWGTQAGPHPALRARRRPGAACLRTKLLSPRAKLNSARGGGADMLDRIPHYVPISAKDEWNLDGMLETM